MSFGEDLLLSTVNFFTSAFTAVTGVGGGMVLIALLPLFIAPQALILVYGATQRFSNASRAWFSRRQINWGYTREYLLLLLRPPAFNRLIRRFQHFLPVGFVHTGMGLFVGAPGPLEITVLHKKTDNHAEVAAAGAAMASITHFMKIPVYAFAGVNLAGYWLTLVMMILAAVLGSWIGVKRQVRFEQAKLKRFLQFALTVLAVMLLVKTLLPLVR